jgi:3-hydroxybutyryl-CoA dehydrogenase
MTEHRFGSAAVIGTGMMGPGIAVTLALGGVRVTLLSRSQDGAAQGLASARRQIDLLKENRLNTAANAEWAAANIDASTDLDAVVPNVDLVVESAPEDLSFKQTLFATLDTHAKPAAILASNTSGLSITAIAERCQRPERVLTTHFWNPPHLMPLVEIVRGQKTSDATAEDVKDLLVACGKIPVLVKKDRPGQLGNRLQFALFREAINIVQEGIADPEDVDLAAKAGFGLRLPVYGIFEHQDIVGLQTGLAIANYVLPDLNNAPKAPRLLHDLVKKGQTGAAAGKGFYDWSVKDADEVKARRDQFVLELMRARRGA